MTNWVVQLAELNFDGKEAQAVQEVLSSEWLTMGQKVEGLECAFQSQMKLHNQPVAVSSATAALHLALMSIGVGKGDEVIIPGLTFVSDANVVCQLGATPVFADITSLTDLNVNVNSIIEKITEFTKVVIVVHFSGVPMELEKLKRVLSDRKILLIEDVAHAPGASINGVPTGTVGDFSFYSFFSNKNIACGEGGMLHANNTDHAIRTRMLRSHGMTSVTIDRHKGRASTYGVEHIGLNYRLDEMRAAIATVQLQKLHNGNVRRNEIINAYIEALSEEKIIIPFSKKDPLRIEAGHIFSILLENEESRAHTVSYLKQHGIQTSVHYPAFHTFSAYNQYIKKSDLPICDQVCARTLTLPLHPKMTESDVKYVCEKLKYSLKK